MKLTIVMMVMVAEIAICPVPVRNTVPETVVQTEAPTEAVQIPTQEGFVAYRIHGNVPPIEWQRYLYNELASRGIAWFMPYAVCQIQQESCWDKYSTNGTDSGLTQQNESYWPARAEHWGVAGASIWDVYAQLHVYACMMCQYLSLGNVEMALSAYYLGVWDYSVTYVDAVMAHWGALEEVR